MTLHPLPHRGAPLCILVFTCRGSPVCPSWIYDSRRSTPTHQPAILATSADSTFIGSSSTTTCTRIRITLSETGLAEMVKGFSLGANIGLVHETLLNSGTGTQAWTAISSPAARQ